ncbi:MAG: hypothetical protein R3A80_12705 [Bdellovibrionota bacterium]
MISSRNHGFGASELLVGLAIASVFGLLATKLISNQTKQQEIAQVRTQMGLLQNQVNTLLRKFESSYFNAHLASDLNLNACFNGQGTDCATQFGVSQVFSLSSYASGAFDANDDLILNGRFSGNGSLCTTVGPECILQTKTEIRYECSEVVCSRGLITSEVSVDGSPLGSEQAVMYGSISKLESEVPLERIKNAGIMRTLASKCAVSQSLAYGNGSFGCVDTATAAGVNDLFDPSFGVNLLNGQLSLASNATGVLVAGGATGGGTSGGTTGGTTGGSSSSSSSSSSSIGTNECLPGYSLQMNDQGQLVCKEVVFCSLAQVKVCELTAEVKGAQDTDITLTAHSSLEPSSSCYFDGFVPQAPQKRAYAMRVSAGQSTTHWTQSSPSASAMTPLLHCPADTTKQNCAFEGGGGPYGTMKCSCEKEVCGNSTPPEVSANRYIAYTYPGAASYYVYISSATAEDVTFKTTDNSDKSLKIYNLLRLKKSTSNAQFLLNPKAAFDSAIVLRSDSASAVGTNATYAFQKQKLSTLSDSGYVNLKSFVPNMFLCLQDGTTCHYNGAQIWVTGLMFPGDLSPRVSPSDSGSGV